MMGRILAVWIISRFLNGTVYSYHGFCKVLRFVNGARLWFGKIAGFKRHGLNAVMYRGFETVKTPEKNSITVRFCPT